MAEDQQQTEDQDSQVKQESGGTEWYVDPNSGAAPQPGGQTATSAPAYDPEDEDAVDPAGPSFGHGEDPVAYHDRETMASGELTPQASVDAQPGAVDDADAGTTDPSADQADQGEGTGDGAGSDEGSGDSTEAKDQYDDKDVWSYAQLQGEIGSRNESREDEEKISAQGSRAELVERLREDDAANADG